MALPSGPSRLTSVGQLQPHQTKRAHSKATDCCTHWLGGRLLTLVGPPHDGIPKPYQGVGHRFTFVLSSVNQLSTTTTWFGAGATESAMRRSITNRRPSGVTS